MITQKNRFHIASEDYLASERISPIKSEQEIVAWFRAKVHQQGGRDYDVLIDEALLEYIKREEAKLAQTQLNF